MSVSSIPSSPSLQQLQPQSQSGRAHGGHHRHGTGGADASGGTTDQLANLLASSSTTVGTTMTTNGLGTSPSGNGSPLLDLLA